MSKPNFINHEIVFNPTGNEKLRQGWKLQGGVSITSHGMSIYCAQAMVKD